jgi:hypothetical protein
VLAAASLRCFKVALKKRLMISRVEGFDDFDNSFAGLPPRLAAASRSFSMEHCGIFQPGSSLKILRYFSARHS